MPLRIVRLGTPRAPGEGTRIGTVRRPPRGVPKAEFASRDYYDVWYPLLSPSPEAMAQAAGIMGFKMMDLKPIDGVLYYFVGSDKLRFRQPVVPGDQLVLEARFISAKRSLWKFACKATVDGKEVCSAEIICAERKL